MADIVVSMTTARRFVLGRQGLWPGRRWQGLAGTRAALSAIEALQLDPLNVVARSHDIALWGRVLDDRPAYLDDLLYRERAACIALPAPSRRTGSICTSSLRPRSVLT